MGLAVGVVLDVDDVEGREALEEAAAAEHGEEVVRVLAADVERGALQHERALHLLHCMPPWRHDTAPTRRWGCARAEQQPELSAAPGLSRAGVLMIGGYVEQSTHVLCRLQATESQLTQCWLACFTVQSREQGWCERRGGCGHTRRQVGSSTIIPVAWT